MNDNELPDEGSSRYTLRKLMKKIDEENGGD
jgi:hypothetical protein